MREYVKRGKKTIKKSYSVATQNMSTMISAEEMVEYLFMYPPMKR